MYYCSLHTACRDGISIQIDEFCHHFLSLVAGHSLSLGINAICRGSIANNVTKASEHTENPLNKSEMY